MNRWNYYTKLALLDLLRLRATVQLHVIIVAGICLPILVLLGLKRGHVEELRKDLLTSPTGRQVIFWAAQRGDFLKPPDVDRLRAELGRVDLIIPVIQRVASVSHTAADGSVTSVRDATFESTRKGDPILAVSGVDVLGPSETGVVLGKPLAEKLKAKAGDDVTLTVTRAGDGGKEEATVSLRVKAVIQGGSEGGIVGYLDVELLDLIERYVQGGQVAAFGWPASRAQARDAYAEFLLFSETELKDGDFQIVRNRGYLVEKTADKDLKTVHGLLKPEVLDKLTVYRLFTTQSRSDPARRLSLRARDVAKMTIADDVVIPWNPPRRSRIDGVEHLVVGVSLPDPTWLKGYFENPQAAFEYGAKERSIFLPFAPRPAGAKSVSLEVDDAIRLALALPSAEATTDAPKSGEAGAATDPKDPPKPVSDPVVPNRPGPALAVVPIELLAHLDAYQHRTVEYDRINDLFVPIVPEPSYDKSRLYATTIDDVVPVVDALYRRNYACRSEDARVREIHGQDASLQLLVVIVGAAVFAFGIVTVVSVLLDSTDRKRGTMGILRVMGISRAGVFYLVFIRAIAIGLLAGALTVALGYLAAWSLAWRPELAWISAWKPSIHTIIKRDDLILIFAGSITCCLAGSLYPAWRASRLDPFEAIVEGRFR